MKPLPHKILLTTCTALIAALSPLAHADKTITFNVPVTVEKLDPQVVRVFAICAVRGNAANSSLNFSEVTESGNVVNGAFTGVLKSVIKVPTDSVGKVDNWECYLRLSKYAGTNGVGSLNVASDPWSKVLPSSTTLVSGKF